MADEKDTIQRLSLQWPALLALVIAAWGIAMKAPPLGSPRPLETETESGMGTPAAESAPARLWQDPVSAIARQERASAAKYWPLQNFFGQHHAGPPEEALSNSFPPDRRPELPKKPILFLVSYLDTRDSPDRAEKHRRERYATLSALATAGYVPVQADRISYVDVCQKRAIGATVAETNRWIHIPFEWFQLICENRPSLMPPAKYSFRKICVLWVADDLVDGEKLKSIIELRKLLQKVKEGGQGINSYALPGWNCLGRLLLEKVKEAGRGIDFRLKVKGPIGSGELYKLLHDHDELAGKPPEAKWLEDLDVIVTNSTADYVRRPLENSSADDIPPRHFKPHTGKLEYMIATDQVVADILIEELINRGLNLSQHDVAIVAEWDTDYGRSMYSTFKQAFKNSRVDGEGSRLYEFSYLRGLDGRVHAAEGDYSSRPASPSETKPSGHPNQSGRDQSSPVPAEGDSQMDYVVRLVESMRNAAPNYDAIGVVGNDVYDKLVLLQALRPYFPGAIFFTTDLDNRLLQPADYPYTRNLLVGSHYGLLLGPALQGKIPPFRDGYTTASYLGSLRALEFDSGDVIESTVGTLNNLPLKSQPSQNLARIYEIGRHSAYDLSRKEKVALRPAGPRAHPWIFVPANWVGIILCGVGTLVVLVLLSRRVRRLFAVVYRPEPRYVAILVAVLGAVALLVLMAISHLRENGEPIDFTEGISAWPNVILRFLATAMSLYFLVLAFGQLKKRNEDIQEFFGWPEDRRRWLGFSAASSPWFWEAPKPPKGQDEVAQSDQASSAPREVDAWNRFRAEGVEGLWRRFCTFGLPGHRLWRSAILTAAAFFLVVGFYLIFSPPISPARGMVARWTDKGLAYMSVLFEIFLLMAIVDATYWCYRFVSCLTDLSRYLEWPTELENRFIEERMAQNPGTADKRLKKAVKPLLTVELVGKAADVVAQMFLYPFIVLLILILAQNRFFDDVSLDIPLTIVVALSALIAVCCAFMLWRSVSKSKEKSLKKVKEVWRQFAGEPFHAPLAEKINQMRLQIEGKKSGAFAPLYSHPIVKALLMPLGGAGGIAVLQALFP
jgi:hypothetical protein